MRGLRWRRAPANVEPANEFVVGIRAAGLDARRGSPQLSRRRRLLAIGTLAAVAVVAASAALAPFALHKYGGTSASSTPSSSATPADERVAQSSATPAASSSHSSSIQPATASSAPTPSVGPEQSYVPIQMNGWPVKWLRSVNGPAGLTMGPDGTVYLASDGSLASAASIAIDRAGHPRAGWTTAVGGRTLVPVAFGSDGTIYSIDAEDGVSMKAYAFNPLGTLKAGWPIELPDSTPIMAGPGDTLYTVSVGVLTIVGPDGKVKATSSPSPDDLCPLDRAVIRSDGTLFILCGTDSSVTAGRVAVFNSAAKKLGSASAELWDGITMGAGGQVVAWRNETVRVGETGYAPLDTVLAALGTDGRPLDGWLKSVGGPASAPVIGPDGSVYIAIESSEREAPSQLIAFDAAGNIKAGWPHSLPDGTAPDGATPRMDGSGQPGVPLYPVSPVVGTDGTVYWVVDDPNGTEYVLAWDSAGHALPGWPVTLPQPVHISLAGPCADWCGPYFDKPVFVKPASGSARLYLHLGDTITALTEDGKVVSGWPKKPEAAGSTFYGWSWWSVTPDGGVVALEERLTDTDVSYALTRWNPDGSVPH